MSLALPERSPPCLRPALPSTKCDQREQHVRPVSRVAGHRRWPRRTQLLPVAGGVSHGSRRHVDRSCRGSGHESPPQHPAGRACCGLGSVARQVESSQNLPARCSAAGSIRPTSGKSAGAGCLAISRRPASAAATLRRESVSAHRGRRRRPDGARFLSRLAALQASGVCIRGFRVRGHSAGEFRSARRRPGISDWAELESSPAGG